MKEKEYVPNAVYTFSVGLSDDFNVRIHVPVKPEAVEKYIHDSRPRKPTTSVVGGIGQPSLKLNVKKKLRTLDNFRTKTLFIM